jgi:hypothetical protein
MATFRKAVKEQVKLRLALCGLAGSGKTFSALAIAKHLIPGARVAVIDTERGSASLYADKFDFDVLELDSFSPLAYVDAIRSAEAEGYQIVVIDSLTHAWSGKDGALDQKDRAADRDPRGNSWTAWRNVTPKHNALVDAMLTSRAHVIATMRTKMEYVQDKDANGRTEIKKVGLAAIQREGMEYEFTLVGDVDLTHTLKISKTRCDGIDVGDMFEKPGESFAKKVYAWLTSGVEPASRPTPAPVVVASEPAAPRAPVEPSQLDAKLDDAFKAYLATMTAAKTQAELDKAAAGPGKPTKGTDDYARAAAHYMACKAAVEKAAAKAEQAQGAA